MIPKKIHYCWFGKKKLPKDVKKCIKSWEKYCPEYEIIRWDETNFDINCNKFIKKAYESKSFAFVSDYARLKIIYNEGGIYLDTDVELVKNIDKLLENECYFATEQTEKCIATGLGFGSVKNNKIIKEMMDVYNNIEFDVKNKNSFTCPILNTKVLKKYGYVYKKEKYLLDKINVMIYSPKYFDPISPGDSTNLFCNDTFSVHHYNASWEKKSYILKRKIVKFIGQEKVNKFKDLIRK